MKKLLLVLCMGVSVSLFVKASNADLFTYNAEKVNQEMVQLQNLENYITANPGLSLTNLQAENNDLVTGLDLSMNSMGGFSFAGEPPLGIPSFLWGCVLGWVGILVVYLVTDNDKDETKKALIGCIVSGAAWVLFYVFWWLIWGSYAWYY